MTAESDESVSSNVKRCFTAIPPTRRFLHSPSMDLFLCPSMDLMVVGSSSSSSSSPAIRVNSDSDSPNTITATTTLVLHRTISPQKLSHKTLETSSASTTCRGNKAEVHRPVTCCWRSDGRVLAVIVEGGEQQEELGSRGRESSSSPSSTSATLQLFAVEDILKEWQTSPATNITSLSWKGSARSVCSMSWSFAGNPHPSWSICEEEEERQWNRDNVHFPMHYPPSEYHFGYTYESSFMSNSNDNLSSHPSATMMAAGSCATSVMMMRGARPHHHHHHELASPHVLPSQSPISLLAVVTWDYECKSYYLSVYLHGRYPWIIDLPLAKSAEGGVGGLDLPSSATPAIVDSTLSSSAQVAVSHTLSYVVVSLPNSILLVAHIPTNVTTGHGNSFSSYSLAAPAIALEYHLQQLLPKTKEIAAAYSSSLKPLDAKLDALAATLTKYSINIEDEGTFSPIAACLATWMVGATFNSEKASGGATSSSLAAAMEQYFSSVQLNDQLLVRLDQSLTVAMANVESQVRQHLLAPSQAMVVQTSELVGLVMSSECIDIKQKQQLVAAARRVHLRATHLLQLVNQVWSELVSTRFWLREILQWLRSTASAVKAQGSGGGTNNNPTANNPLAQHAAQRRVSDALTRRILARLQQQANTTLGSNENNKCALESGKVKQGRTEQIFGLTGFAKMMAAECEDNDGSSSTTSIASTALALKLELEELLRGPRQQAWTETIVQQWMLSQHAESDACCQRATTVTTRLGAGGGIKNRRAGGDVSSTGGPGSKDCFVPGESAPRNCKEWIVTASYSRINQQHQEKSGAGIRSIVDLHVVPMSMNDDIDTGSGTTSSYVWMTRLLIGGESGKKVVDAVFYGDDGKSSLSAMDGGTGQERRQALALIVETASAAAALELWLVVYDDCPFQKVPVKNGRVALSDKDALTIPVVEVLPLPSSSDAENANMICDGGHIVLYARTRSIATGVDPNSSVRLVVSGSRGVGAVLALNPPENGNTTTIDLYDLEEDGEDDDGMSTDY